MLTLLFVTVIIVSCSGDDDGPQMPTNKISVDNTNTFEIGQAKLFSDGTFNGITEFQFYITSTGLSVNNNEEFAGNGDLLSLRLFSGSTSGLEEGNYVFNQQDTDPFILNRGFHFFNYVASLGDNQIGDIDIESGSITVTLENDIYTITLNLVDEDGNAVTGYYSGMIEVVF